MLQDVIGYIGVYDRGSHAYQWEWINGFIAVAVVPREWALSTETGTGIKTWYRCYCVRKQIQVIALVVSGV